MKTRIEITHEIFKWDVSLEESEQIFKEEFEEYGFTLDMRNQICYKEYNRHIHLNVGDRIDMNDKIFRTITWKCYNPDEDLFEYQTEKE